MKMFLLCFLRSTKERKQTLISEMMAAKADIARLGKHQVKRVGYRLSFYFLDISIPERIV